MVDVLGSRVVGPLESYAPGFAAGLSRQGYTVSGASQHLCFIGHLSRWMLAGERDVSALTPEVVDEYLAARRSAGYVNHRSVRAMRPLLDYLEPLGVLPQLAPVALGPVDALLERYRGYLIIERGLTAATACGYLCSVRPFVAGRARQDGLDLAGVTASDVNRFVLDACQHRATGSAELIVTALRSLLNFLHLSDEMAESLTSAVPSVAGWALSGLPKGLRPDELRALLASCDRRRATGRRDYAIMLMLSRLGLRAGEVAALGLDDIDWHAGQFVVRGKGNRVERLPLPADVGAAVAGYLRRGRPVTAQGRSVFVRVKARFRKYGGPPVDGLTFEWVFHDLGCLPDGTIVAAGRFVEPDAEVQTGTVVFLEDDGTPFPSIAEEWLGLLNMTNCMARDQLTGGLVLGGLRQPLPLRGLRARTVQDSPVPERRMRTRVSATPAAGSGRIEP